MICADIIDPMKTSDTRSLFRCTGKSTCMLRKVAVQEGSGRWYKKITAVVLLKLLMFFLKINLRCFEALVLLWNSCSFSFWKNWKENLSNFSALPQVKPILLSQKDRKGCIYYVEKRKILFQTKLKWRDSCFHRITQVDWKRLLR